MRRARSPKEYLGQRKRRDDVGISVVDMVGHRACSSCDMTPNVEATIMVQFERRKRAKIGGVVAVLSLLLCGCTLGGAAAGGYAGNRLTHGSTAGTVGGAVAGGVVGYELSK
jgi:osmotically inducible lipoprotein OsmB